MWTNNMNVETIDYLGRYKKEFLDLSSNYMQNLSDVAPETIIEAHEVDK